MKYLLLFPVAIVLILSVIVFISLDKYSSAFEADQQCHFYQYEMSGKDRTRNCDHDLETRQWLLYQTGEDHQPAVVLRRFRY